MSLLCKLGNWPCVEGSYSVASPEINLRAASALPSITRLDHYIQTPLSPTVYVISHTIMNRYASYELQTPQLVPEGPYRSYHLPKDFSYKRRDSSGLYF